jgi:hypothetical protein
MSTVVYVPRDATALALGAEAVAIARPRRRGDFPTGIKWKTVQATRAARRNTSSATPTRATRARSPTAC